MVIWSFPQKVTPQRSFSPGVLRKATAFILALRINNHILIPAEVRVAFCKDLILLGYTPVTVPRPTPA